MVGDGVKYILSNNVRLTLSNNSILKFGTNEPPILPKPKLYNWYVINQYYTDWFLPSISELTAVASEIFYSYNLGGFSDEVSYWSSTQDSDTSARGVLFSQSNLVDSAYDKSTTLAVRPIRTFTSDRIYSIRDRGPANGYIFYINYIDGTNYEYYEVSSSNISDTPRSWSNVINGSVSTGPNIGDGINNTANIIEQVGHTDSAAKVCNDYSYGDKISPNGWSVPTYANILTLVTYLGGSSVAGGALKEEGVITWNTPNDGATNSSGFTALGNGYRQGASGFFDQLGASYTMWSTTYSHIMGLFYDNPTVWTNGAAQKDGLNIRCVTTIDPGVTTITDYDGNIYDVIQIGTQWWLKQDLKVTHYNDGSDIVYIADNSEWAALTTGAYCTYNNL